ncbi:hypothetical protein [Candidatus Halobonum tyrrellensis]|nr:hypothetical protein [Candidatus Halobonum tyrrellensis]
MPLTRPVECSSDLLGFELLVESELVFFTHVSRASSGSSNRTATT